VSYRDEIEIEPARIEDHRHPPVGGCLFSAGRSATTLMLALGPLPSLEEKEVEPCSIGMN
jgi:hypothetical protein